VSPTSERVRELLRALERQGSRKVREEQRTRYGIVTDKAFGVPMARIQHLARGLGRDHTLALALWKTGWYEARLLTAYVDEPERVTPTQMDHWARDWDNWGIVDTLCFALFDRTPHAWAKVKQWSRRPEEFVRRGSFALLACLALHDRSAADQRFLAALPLIEPAARDPRNFVRKGAAWALRAVGGRNPALRAAVASLAERLVESEDRTAQSLGRGALRELRRPARKTARG
jgi:3-methyladenine DNA glycosylase AlkD